MFFFLIATCKARNRTTSWSLLCFWWPCILQSEPRQRRICAWWNYWHLSNCQQSKQSIYQISILTKIIFIVQVKSAQYNTIKHFWKFNLIIIKLLKICYSCIASFLNAWSFMLDLIICIKFCIIITTNEIYMDNTIMIL